MRRGHCKLQRCESRRRFGVLQRGEAQRCGSGGPNGGDRRPPLRIVPGVLMPVGLLTLELHIPDAQSLKDKRQVLRSLKDKLRRQFNVAVAELDHHDVWQRSVVGVVTLSNEEKHLKEVLQKVLDEADRILGSFLINQAIEII